MSKKHRVAVVGAGPHGLSVAAYLRDAKVQPVVFGEVMGFWRRHMPAGMLLRSERRGSHIADPAGQLTIDRFEAELGRTLPRRISLEDYIEYGRWFQCQAVPEIDARRVTHIERDGRAGFRLTLNGSMVEHAEHVVVATGLKDFAERPRTFADVPPELAPHSSDVNDPALYKGLEVAVIGAGQAAIELAVLLSEAGANVEVLARTGSLKFTSANDVARRSLISRIIYPPGEVGPPGVNWVIELPPLFRSLTPDMRRWVSEQVRAKGAGWLLPRMQRVRVTTGRSVAAAVPSPDRRRVKLVLDDASERELDRVILATGYRADLKCIPILAPELAQSIRRHHGGAPELGAGFESSVPGLHFVGAAAAVSFGPLMRHVAGTGYTARSVTRCVLASPRH